VDKQRAAAMAHNTDITASTIRLGEGSGKEDAFAAAARRLELLREDRTDSTTEENVEEESLDEDVWGNDKSIIKRLDEDSLADRRLFIRVRHMRQVECHMLYEHIGDEPINLTRPMIFTICDLSMGGIDIISDDFIDAGKILSIRIILDEIPYEFKGEVVFCLKSEDKFRIGLKIVQRDRTFIRHLKIFIARISLNSRYGRAI
jgi:hypothetical protein